MKPFIVTGRVMPWTKIFATALLVGTLDITCACLSSYIQRGTMPERVFQYIGSGVFGKSSFTGGTTTALWGLLFHYVIATGFTIAIFLLFRYGLFPLKNIIITGILAGLGIWATMHYLVVPLSNVPRGGSLNLKGFLISAGILTVAIGIPASLIAHKHFNRSRVSAVREL